MQLVFPLLRKQHVNARLNYGFMYNTLATSHIFDDYKQGCCLNVSRRFFGSLNVSWPSLVTKQSNYYEYNVFIRSTPTCAIPSTLQVHCKFKTISISLVHENKLKISNNCQLKTSDSVTTRSHNVFKQCKCHSASNFRNKTGSGNTGMSQFTAQLDKM